jgi:hypothetical protein
VRTRTVANAARPAVLVVHGAIPHLRRMTTFRRSPSRAMYLLPLALLALGIGSCAKMFGSFDHLPRALAPGESTVKLAGGSYAVMIELKSQLNGRVYETSSVSGLGCKLTSADGTPVELEKSSTHLSYTSSSYQGQSAWSIDVPRAGDYQLDCGYDDAEAGSPVVVAFMPGGGGSFFSSILLTLGGVFGGFVSLIVVFVLRHRRPPREPLPPPPPLVHA